MDSGSALENGGQKKKKKRRVKKEKKLQPSNLLEVRVRIIACTLLLENVRSARSDIRITALRPWGDPSCLKPFFISSIWQRALSEFLS